MRVEDFEPHYTFRGRHSDGDVATFCSHVHDGDTIRVKLVLPVWHLADEWLRVRSLWCPELREPGGPEAREFVCRLLLGKPVWIQTHKRPSDDEESRSFVRLIADVGFDPAPDGTLRDLATVVVGAGHGTRISA